MILKTFSIFILIVITFEKYKLISSPSTTYYYIKKRKCIRLFKYLIIVWQSYFKVTSLSKFF